MIELIKMIKKYGDLNYDSGYYPHDEDQFEEALNYFDKIVDFIRNKME